MISGFLCGNLGVLKSYLTEITDDSNRGRGFSMVSVAWFLGCALAPLAGGLLSKPADRYPRFFSQDGLFGDYPYFLPCLLCVVLNVSSSIFCLFAMVESRKFGEQNGGHAEGANIEMVPTQKFSIIGEDDDEDSEEGEDPDAEWESENEEEDEDWVEYVNADDMEKAKPSTVLDSPSRGRLLLQRMIGGSAEKGKYTKLSGSEENANPLRPEVDSADATDTDTLASSSTADGVVRGVVVDALKRGKDEYDENSEGRQRQRKRRRRGSPDRAGNEEGGKEGEGVPFWGCCWTTDRRERNGSVLCERVVLLATSNYGMLAMAYIIVNETIPLFLKLDISQGGFSMDSGSIGILLSISGASMLIFALVVLPFFASMNPLRLFHLGIVLAIPFSMGWPFVAMLHSSVLEKMSSPMGLVIMWILLGQFLSFPLLSISCEYLC